MGRPENTMSKDDAVCTPKDIWGPVVEALGTIGLDPCSNPASTVPALSQVLLPIYWTDPDKPAPTEWQDGGDHDFLYADGLTLHWGDCGLVWLNPPYSELPDAKGRPSWLGKFVSEVDEGVAFVPVRSASEWWQNYVPRCDAITLLAQRVVHDNIFRKKDSKDGKKKAGEPITEGAAFSQALLYRGPRAGVWALEARHHGMTFMRVEGRVWLLVDPDPLNGGKLIEPATANEQLLHHYLVKKNG